MSQVLPGNQSINGRTQGELAERWVAQVNSISETDSPFNTNDELNPRGRRGTIELHESFQADSPEGVFFLGGSVVLNTVPVPPPAVRTIVNQAGTTYFAPFVNILVDNTTNDFAPTSEFPGGYAFTPQHLQDLQAAGINPRDLVAAFGQPTWLEVLQSFATGFSGQSVTIDGVDATPASLNDYRHETANVGYDDLPRSTGARAASIEGGIDKAFVADPDLGQGLEDQDPANDIFPTLESINPDLQNLVVPFVHIGDYFAVELDPGAHTLQFTGTSFGDQNVVYDVLNPIEGTRQGDQLSGTDDNDYIRGKRGRDKLSGLDGDDLVIGGKGGDRVDGGKGNDELWGDGGKDRFIYKFGYGMDTIFDLEARDVVRVSGFSSDTNILTEMIELPSGVDAVRITFNENDTLTIVKTTTDPISINLGENSLTI